MKIILLIASMLFCLNSSMANNIFVENESPVFEMQRSSASLTISNKSEYVLTIKLMRVAGGIYTTLRIAPNSSGRVSFSSSGTFYVKSKAEKSFSSTLYKKDSPFQIQCDSSGYTEANIEYYVSGGGGSAGATISKSEFEKNE